MLNRRALPWVFLPALVFVGMTFFYARQGSHGGQEGVPRGGAARDEPPARPGGGASPEEPSPAEGPLITSDTGLPLASVEVSDGGAAWRRVALVEGRLPASDLAGVQRLRAAGHLPVSLGPGDEALVLPAWSVLRVAGARARDRIRDVRLAAERGDLGRREFGGRFTAGCVDGATWILAVEPDERRRELFVELALSDGTALRIEFRPRRASSVALALPAPLDVGSSTAPGEIISQGVSLGADGAPNAAWSHLAGPSGSATR